MLPFQHVSNIKNYERERLHAFFYTEKLIECVFYIYSMS